MILVIGFLEVLVYASMLVAMGVVVGLLLAWSRPSLLRKVEETWKRLGLP